MDCPFCQGSSRVVDSRPSVEGIRRRRECQSCKRRFTTQERALPIELRVMKARGRQIEDFELEKLVTSLQRICKGRPISQQEISRVAHSIEAKLADSGRTVVTSLEIAAMLLSVLKDLDPIIHDRLASNYIGLEEEVPSAAETGKQTQLTLFHKF